jgi:hypothetical protein
MRRAWEVRAGSGGEEVGDVRRLSRNFCGSGGKSNKGDGERREMQEVWREMEEEGGRRRARWSYGRWTKRRIA